MIAMNECNGCHGYMTCTDDMDRKINGIFSYQKPNIGRGIVFFCKKVYFILNVIMCISICVSEFDKFCSQWGTPLKPIIVIDIDIVPRPKK